MMGPQKLAGFARSSERRRWRFGSFAGCGRSWPVVGVVGYHKGNLKKHISFWDFLEILGEFSSNLGNKNTVALEMVINHSHCLGPLVNGWVGRDEELLE